MIPSKIRIVSLIFKSALVIAAVIGVVISALASKETVMGGGRVFMFFTIQSNIAIALISAPEILWMVKGTVPGRIFLIIKFAGTISITLTGVVFTVVLAPTLGSFAWLIQNVLTHMVVPVLAIVDFFLIGTYGDLDKKTVPFVILPPLFYAIYAGIAYVAGWEFSEGINYPYFFLNWGSPAGAFGFSSELPFMGCVWWILILLMFLLGIGFLYLWILGKIRKRTGRGQ